MTESSVKRASRFDLDLPVRYRLGGEDAWSYGVTVNISSSGVLFRSARPIECALPIELQVVLPGDRDGGARVLSRGSVARTVSSGGSAHYVIAATIDAYELARTAPDAPDPIYTSA